MMFRSISSLFAPRKKANANQRRGISFEDPKSEALQLAYRKAPKFPKKFHLDTWFPNIRVAVTKDGLRKMDTIRPRTELTLKYPPMYGKSDMKAFLKQVYQLPVVKINTLNYEGSYRKHRVSGRIRRKQNYKKAYVQCKGINEYEEVMFLRQKAKEESEAMTKEAEKKKEKKQQKA